MTVEKISTKKIWSSGTSEHHTSRKRVKYCGEKCHILCCRTYLSIRKFICREDSKLFIDAFYMGHTREEWNSAEATNSCNDYNKLWTKAQNCAGLQHMLNNNIFNCFKIIEVIAYQLIKSPLVKCGIMEFRYWIPEVPLF